VQQRRRRWAPAQQQQLLLLLRVRERHCMRGYLLYECCAMPRPALSPRGEESS
jgi:hypothetical protein